jgi:hypothetical protein
MSDSLPTPDAAGSGGVSRGAHRPIPMADLTRAGGAESVEMGPGARAELAASTAAAVLAAAQAAAAAPDDIAGPDGATSDGGAAAASRERLVALAETVGLDTLAELWRDSDPDALPGALWALYLVRAWSRADGDGVARLWRAGRGLAPADEVVAGVHDDADPQALAALADAVLTGAYGSDFGVALDRAAAFFRVIAEGRRALAADDSEAELTLAARNERVAAGLTRAAARWRAGQLT